MLFNLFSLFYLISGLLGIVVTLQLLWANKSGTRDWNLIIFITCLSVCTLYIFSYTTGTLVYFPNLFDLAKVTSFLIAPSAFLYIRNSFLVRKAFRYNDLMHYVPCMISLAITCFYHYKVQQTDGQHGSIWNEVTAILKIDSYYLRVCKTILWMGYIVVQTQILLNYEKHLRLNKLHDNSRIINWLKSFNLMSVLLFSAILVGSLVRGEFYSMEFMTNTVSALTLLVISCWLIFNRGGMQVASGAVLKELQIHNMVERENHTPVFTKESAVFITSEKRENYLKTLETFLEKDRPYLKKGITIRDFSDATEIPVHHLSFLINSESHMHFQDFVNGKRINYIKEKIHDPSWKCLSLEGIAWAAGFSSRTTFYRAFLKLTGQSPSEFFNCAKHQQDGELNDKIA